MCEREKGYDVSLVIYLSGHNALGGQMNHTTDRTAIARAQFLQCLQIFAPEIQLELDAELQVWQGLATRIMATFACCWCASSAHGHVVEVGTAAGRCVCVGGLVQGQVLEIALFADRAGGYHLVDAM